MGDSLPPASESDSPLDSPPNSALAQTSTQASLRSRLMWVTTELRTGGAERCLVRLARELQSQGFDSTVVSLQPLPQSRTELLELLHQAGIEVVSLEARRATELPRVVRSLKQLIAERRPHFLSSFLFHANVVTAWARRDFPSIPWIANVRVADPRRWRMMLERRALASASHVACVSHEVAEACRRKLRIEPTRLSVIPNGVDLAEIDRQLAAGLATGSPQGSSDFRVAMVGRLEAQKGIDRLFEAWAKRPPLPEGLQLGVVGEGSEREALIGLAERLGIARVPVWLGWQSRPWERLARTEVILIPSRFEGMSNAMLEAMAAGKIVLATDVAGVQEVLEKGADLEPYPSLSDGSAWQIVRGDRLDPMLTRLSQVLADSKLSEQIRGWNRRRIERCFAWPIVVQRYRDLLASLA